MENLFSYGTLQLEQIQLSTFNRKLEGQPDTLIGYKMSFIAVDDPAVVASSGISQYPILTLSNNTQDVITGSVFMVTAAELQQADEYEAEDYKRVNVILKSGKNAWVYVGSKDT